MATSTLGVPNPETPNCRHETPNPNQTKPKPNQLGLRKRPKPKTSQPPGTDFLDFFCFPPSPGLPEFEPTATAAANNNWHWCTPWARCQAFLSDFLYPPASGASASFPLLSPRQPARQPDRGESRQRANCTANVYWFSGARKHLCPALPPSLPSPSPSLSLPFPSLSPLFSSQKNKAGGNQVPSPNDGKATQN